jgi:hypothetical protein
MKKLGMGRKGRIYEYTNEDGVTFWSFERLPHLVSPAQRLRLGSRVGTEFTNHLVDLRTIRNYYEKQKEEE